MKKNSYIFRDYYGTLKKRLSADYTIDVNFNWYKYYEAHPEHLNMSNFFESLLYEKGGLDEKIFNGNEEYYFKKYVDVVCRYPGSTYSGIRFNLADFIWNKFVKKDKYTVNRNKLTFEQKLMLIPHLSSIHRELMFRIFEGDYPLCYKMLEFLDYKLNKKELTILYCREEMELLEKIDLQVDDELLQKALVYGRKNVIEYLDKKGLLEKHSNPFVLDKIEDFYSAKEIWYGWSWGNDEYERDIIGKSDYIECFKICKKYFTLEDAHFDKWLQMTNYSDNGYGPDIQDIVEFFINKDDFNSKESIIKIINKFGKVNIWNIISKKSSSILDVLME